MKDTADRNLVPKAAWLATLLFAALMTLSGARFLLGPRPIVESLQGLGYPPLRPEVALVVLSTAAFLLEQRRSRQAAALRVS